MHFENDPFKVSKVCFVMQIVGKNWQQRDICFLTALSTLENVLRARIESIACAKLNNIFYIKHITILSEIWQKNVAYAI